MKAWRPKGSGDHYVFTAQHCANCELYDHNDGPCQRMTRAAMGMHYDAEPLVKDDTGPRCLHYCGFPTDDVVQGACDVVASMHEISMAAEDEDGIARMVDINGFGAWGTNGQALRAQLFLSGWSQAEARGGEDGAWWPPERSFCCDECGVMRPWQEGVAESSICSRCYVRKMP